MQPLILMEINIAIAFTIINHQMHDSFTQPQNQTGSSQKHHAAVNKAVSHQTPNPGNPW